MESLYVEPDETGRSWTKPWEIDRDESRDFIVDAVNDYSTEPELFLRKYDGRPEANEPLPPPKWPGISQNQK
ncbi:MAG TPA: hypothetical protein VJ755_06280 [Gemmatimonadales bacterium]|nr:hypothetical protein [Gemmatimonadales bacterium]